MYANAQFTEKTALYIRLATGLAFGLVLAWLVKSDQHISAEAGRHSAPEVWRNILLNVLSMGAFVLWAGAASMRRLTFIIWGLISFGLIGFITWHQNAVEPMQNLNTIFEHAYLILPLLFISNELVSSADQAGKPIAPYALYFDEAWKHGVQLALSLLFTGLFWAILGLGAALLGFIGIKWFKDLISNEYFAFAATGLSIGIAVHLGDVQPKLLGSVRTLVLSVLSWLLLVITIVGVIFAVSLLFTGLKPLWDTKAATVTLLSFCVAIVLLINAAYQQGDTERDINIVMKWATRAACLLLLVFSAIAAISLKLRIDQYGLTADRVIALLSVIIAVAYGLSYSICAVWPKGRWMTLIEPCNIGLAALKCVLFFAVLTPIADPRRLGVNDQVYRLVHNKVANDKFDWAMLRYESGAYGKAALKKLTLDPTYGAKAKEAMGWQDNESYSHRLDPEAPAIKTLKIDPKNYTVILPKGSALPDSFLTQAFYADAWQQPPCLQSLNKNTCHVDVALLDLNKDKTPEMLMLTNHSLTVMTYDSKAGWYIALSHASLSDAEVADFTGGKLSSTAAQWDDIMIGESRFPMKENR